MTDRLDLEAVEIRDGPLRPIPAAEVDALEATLGIPMPAGYREYVTRLGDGELASLRVLPPAEILARLEEHRASMAAWWVWDPGDVPFGQEDALESIQIADTYHGDRFVIAPDLPGRIVALPRSASSLVAIDGDVLALAAWLCSGGLGYRRTKRRLFRPYGPEWLTRPRRPVEPEAGAGPPELARPGMSPEEVLLAYLAELEALERWFIGRHGGPEAFRQVRPPADPPEEDQGRFARTCSAIAQRYCTPTLAREGPTGWITAEPPHGDARILERHAGRAGRVRLDAVHGRDLLPYRHIHLLEPVAGEWRIAAVRMEVDDTLLDLPRETPDRWAHIRDHYPRTGPS